MTKETYLKITGKLREDPQKAAVVKRVDGILTGFVYLIYPAYLLMLFLEKSPFLLRAVLVPGISFVCVSLFRKFYDAPRPYEKFGVPPVLEKDTKGKSFPSRHVFSIFVIAMTFFYLYPGVGILLGIAGIGLGIIRVMGGVHEIKDVVTGAIVGIVSGMIGFYVL